MAQWRTQPAGLQLARENPVETEMQSPTDAARSSNLTQVLAPYCNHRSLSQINGFMSGTEASEVTASLNPTCLQGITTATL